MELTYETMEQFIKDYYDMIPTLTNAEADRAKLMEFLAPDAIVRRSSGSDLKPGEVIIEHVEQRVNRLCGHSDKYRAVITYEPYPLYLAVDDRKNIVTSIIREKFVDPVTGEYYGEVVIFSLFELILDANNKIKIKRELVQRLGGAMGIIEPTW